MFTKKHYINSISLLLIGFVSILFVFKYSELYLDNSIIITLAFAVLFFYVFYSLDKVEVSKLVFLDEKFFKIILGALIIILFLTITLLPKSIEVPRLIAIDAWLNRFFSGEFPYDKSEYSFAFPVFYLFASPFYLIGKVGYLDVIALALFSIILLQFSKTVKEKMMRILVLIFSPLIFYGLIDSGGLFMNVIFVMALILLTEKFVDPNKFNFEFLLYAVLFGLALSTNLEVAIIYGIYFLYFFRNNLPKAILFFSIVLFSFFMSFLPFILLDSETFFQNGPFTSELFLAYMPAWSVAVLIVVVLYIGWSVADLQEVFFASGILVFLPLLISMLIDILNYGFYKTLITSIFDISYFIFCLPFFILSIKEYKVDKFLGKVLAD